MTEELKKSQGGDRIIKYSAEDAEIKALEVDSNTADIVDKHLRMFFSRSDIYVFHEIIPQKIHIDIYVVKANKERPYNILVTSGLSSAPMKTPKEQDEYKYAELFMLLPKDWLLTNESFKDENNYWPIRCLKKLASFPHYFDAWLWFGHTIPNGDPPEPFASKTKLCGSILLPPSLPSKEFGRIKEQGKTIFLLNVVPLYEEEMNYKLRKGVNGLLSRFDKFRISEVVDINRENTCKKKFGIF